jgi:hypothetical protein
VAATTTATPPKPSAPFSPERAHVLIHGLEVTGLHESAARSALTRAQGPIMDCWRDGLRKLGHNMDANEHVVLDLDVNRPLSHPQIVGPAQPGRPQDCVLGALRRVTVADDAIGKGTIDARLTFLPH